LRVGCIDRYMFRNKIVGVQRNHRIVMLHLSAMYTCCLVAEHMSVVIVFIVPSVLV
jgi:hypothetical protein